mmetsp:Transcript_35719/g.70739  ORF Transcript_35719/g.70739 Transcript_35719/m.70739 type:complete len:152 (+) Transcript_35719:2612-3067(+)
MVWQCLAVDRSRDFEALHRAPGEVLLHTRLLLLTRLPLLSPLALEMGRILPLWLKDVASAADADALICLALCGLAGITLAASPSSDPVPLFPKVSLIRLARLKRHLSRRRLELLGLSSETARCSGGLLCRALWLFASTFCECLSGVSGLLA